MYNTTRPMFVHAVPSKDNDNHAPHNILTHAHKDSSATPSQPSPSRAKKNVPSILVVPHPRTPKRCNVDYQQSRVGDRFRGAKKSFPSCSRTVFRSRQHCKGGAGWPQARDGSGDCRGDVFRSGREGNPFWTHRHRRPSDFCMCSGGMALCRVVH